MPERVLHEGGSSGSRQPKPPRTQPSVALGSALTKPGSLSDGHSLTLRTSQSEKPNALIIEPRHLMAKVLCDRGFQCERHEPRAVNTQYTSHVPAQLSRGAYQLIWIEFPRKADRENGRGIIGRLMLWLETCSRALIPAFMFGPVGPHWRDAHLIQLINREQVYRTIHRACHFGLKIDATQEEPSSAAFVCVSTVNVEPHPCLCKVSQECHKLDWHTQEPSRQRQSSCSVADRHFAVSPARTI